jgi:glycosyltransferase involved in cell wall biosynthesis
MKLLIISDMPHHRRSDGSVVGWGPTVREIDELAKLFSEVRHIGCLYQGDPPANALPYLSGRVTFVPVPPSGGETLFAKLQILVAAPIYLRKIAKELRSADVVHVRCPANISLLTLLLLATRRSPKRRWAKYAGSWPRQEQEAWSYRFQRWWLTRMWRDRIVTVNGDWPNQPVHVHAFLNPCLTDAELNDALSTCRRALDAPVHLLFVGSLLNGKGVLLLPDILAAVRQRGAIATLDVVGDGPERRALESLVRDRSLSEHVTLHGWLPRPTLSDVYRRAHVLLLPSGSVREGVWSSAEGWPKVLSEGMAYGVVPVASPVSSVPQYLQLFGVGSVVDSNHPDAYARAVCAYVQDPDRWAIESTQGTKAAAAFTYRAYVERIGALLGVTREVVDATLTSARADEAGVHYAAS